MGIDISTLKQSDKGRKVLYSPDESNTDRNEHGTISSWNDHFVFVRYGTGDTAAATEPYHLLFADDGVENLLNRYDELMKTLKPEDLDNDLVKQLQVHLKEDIESHANKINHIGTLKGKLAKRVGELVAERLESEHPRKDE